MIAKNIVERNIKPGREKREVFRWQISTGKDQIDPRKALVIKFIIKYIFNTV
jgi:hypothetical protein